MAEQHYAQIVRGRAMIRWDLHAQKVTCPECRGGLTSKHRFEGLGAEAR